MSSDPRPLNVVVVSDDVPLLHEISWTLESVGYHVQATHDVAQDALWRRYSFADIIIVDSRSVPEPTGDTFAHDSDNPLYRFFIYDPAKRTDFAAWYAAGAHDGLRLPLSRGELLSRARTGARYLEFERRLRHQSARSVVPGMYSRRGLLQRLRKLAVGDDQSLSQCAILATAIDWYAGIRRKGGESAGRNLVNTAARAIRRAVGESSVSAYLGDGRFATLLIGQSTAVAKAFAETLATDFASRDSIHESIPRPTLTSAIVPWTAGSTVDAFVAEALETLTLAGHVGGGKIVLHGEFNKSFSAWKEEMLSGSPFANVVAQDIMEPFARAFDGDGQPSHAGDGLHKLAALAMPGVTGDQQPVGGNSDPYETIAFDASFADIYEAFSTRGCASLVVTDGGRPLGYLTCEGFLSLIDPIHAESFAHSEKPVDELAYLVVPSTIDEAAAAGVTAV